MIMSIFYDLTLHFFMFSLCGWICELLYRSIAEKTLVNPGFLNGPICPIYGLGGLSVVHLLEPFGDNIIILFLMGTVICTLLEYIASFVLEKLFHTSWWDYSNIRFNVKGRVCLSFSLLFGALSVVVNIFLAPAFAELTDMIPAQVKPWLVWSLMAIFAADTAVTVYSILQLNGKLAELHKLTAEVKSRLESLQGGSLGLSQRLEALKNPRQRFQHRRLFRAFPDMRSTKYTEQLNQIKSSFKGWVEKRADGQKK